MTLQELPNNPAVGRPTVKPKVGKANEMMFCVPALILGLTGKQQNMKVTSAVIQEKLNHSYLYWNLKSRAEKHRKI